MVRETRPEFLIAKGRKTMYPFSDGSFAVKNGWYVIAWAHEIGRQPTERNILNEPVALYTTEAGDPVAIGGRCPHRHFPLAAGCLRGDDIVCGYHGIAFGPDGRCTDIPSQDHIPTSYRVRHYPLVKHWEWLFIWPGDPDKADPALLPDLGEIGITDPRFVARPFYFHEINARYQLMNDNLLDLSHLAYLHGSSIGVKENATTHDVRQESDRWMRSTRLLKAVPQAPFLQADPSYTGPVDRLVQMDFCLPGFHWGVDDTVRSESASQVADDLLMAFKVYHAVTPATFDTSYYFFAMAAMQEDHLNDKYEQLIAVVGEDIFASQAIERMLKLYPQPPGELMLKSDTHAVRGRRLLQAMMDAEATAN